MVTCTKWQCKSKRATCVSASLGNKIGRACANADAKTRQSRSKTSAAVQLVWVRVTLPSKCVSQQTEETCTACRVGDWFNVQCFGGSSLLDISEEQEQESLPTEFTRKNFRDWQVTVEKAGESISSENLMQWSVIRLTTSLSTYHNYVHLYFLSITQES